MLEKEYPPFKSDEYMIMEFDPAKYVLGQHIAHYFEIDGEPEFHIGEITKIPANKATYWVTYSDGSQHKSELPEEGCKKFW